MIRSGSQRMTSLEIAELTGKNHFDLMRAIRKMEEAWEKINGCKFALVGYTDKKGELYRLTPEYEGRGLAQDRLFIYYAKDGKQRERSYLVWTQKGAEEIRRTLNIEH